MNRKVVIKGERSKRKEEEEEEEEKKMEMSDKDNRDKQPLWRHEGGESCVWIIQKKPKSEASAAMILARVNGIMACGYAFKTSSSHPRDRAEASEGR